MNGKVLSVIIPVYNMEKYLSQCLDSVILPEEEGSYEVFVVNDGSKDSSLAIANEYEKKYPDIITVIDKENGGYGSVFNVGINLAYGKYVKILDSDDFFDKEAFALYLKQLKSCNEDLVLNGIMALDDKKNHIIGRYNTFISPKGQINSSFDSRFRDFFLHNFAFRRDLLFGFSCPENSLYTDSCILLSGIIAAKTAFWTNLDLYIYRLNRDGQSVALKSIYLKSNDFLVVLENLYSQISGCKKVSDYTIWLCSFIIETGVHQRLKNICLQKLGKRMHHSFCFELNRYKKFRNCYGFDNIKPDGFFVRWSMWWSSLFYYFWHFYLICLKRAKFY